VRHLGGARKMGPMLKAITHFIWEYQQHFRSSVEIGAERILNSLAPNLEPEVFLVGVRVNDDERLRPACVEPELHHWAESASLYDVLRDVEPIKRSYPESEMFHSHPIAQANEDRQLFRRALRDAVLRRLEGCAGRPPGLRIFASIPVEREGFLVLTLIAVYDAGLSTVPAVTDGEIHIHSHRSFRVPCSLVEAAIDEMLARANEEIIQPDAGAGLWVLGSTDDILRKAGVRFFSGLLHRVDTDSQIVGTAAFVFDAISRLSLTPYERAEPAGSIVFAGKNKNIGTPVLMLAAPVPIKQVRALRKLLVLANDGLVLRCDCGHVLSLVDGAAPQDTDTSRGCEVRITGRGKWIVSMSGRELMSIADGHPSLPKPLVDEQALAFDLRRLIPTMTKESAAIFAQVGRCLATSGHGALLVIAENAEDEAVRLGNDGLSVAPIKLTPELSPRLTAIDGAVLCSASGICHAVGVILDGLSVSVGDRGRGSRFNSASRYVASCQRACAAMVVSEDGGLDLLPRLKPAISKVVLLSRLSELESVAHAPPSPPNREREASVIMWIEEHAFYLSEEQCASANECITKCDERHAQDPEVTVRILRQPLQPNPDFNPARDLI
jgi:hypothetical protein